MIKAVLPFMRKRRKGRIISVMSMGGLMTRPGAVLLPRQQIRVGGNFIFARQRGEELRNLRDRIGARFVSNRLGGPLDGAFGAVDFGLERTTDMRAIRAEQFSATERFE